MPIHSALLTVFQKYYCIILEVSLCVAGKRKKKVIVSSVCFPVYKFKMLGKAMEPTNDQLIIEHKDCFSKVL